MGRKAVAIQADISSYSNIVRMFDEAVQALGKLDIVMSNSGTECFAPIEETTPELYDKVMNLNTRGQFFVAQQAYIHMNEHGRIILMSSVAAHMRGWPVMISIPRARRPSKPWCAPFRTSLLPRRLL